MGTFDAPLTSLAPARAAFADTLIGKSPRTQHTYRTALDRFAEYLVERAIDPAASPSAWPVDVLERFYTWLVRRYGRANRPTCATYVAGVRAFFRFLERRGVAPGGVPFEQLQAGLRAIMGRGSYKTPRIDPGLPLIVTTADAVPLPPDAPETRQKRLELLRDRALLRTLFCTGVRRAEAASLNREDVGEGWVDQAIITGKGEKERVVFFDQATLAAIRVYLAERGDTWMPLFIRHDRARGRARAGGQNYRITPQTVFDVVKRYGRQAGVDASPHDFRHEKASVLLNAGAALSEVQDILGHASPETTKKIYAHYETAHLREAFDRYSRTPEELAKRSPRS